MEGYEPSLWRYKLQLGETSFLFPPCGSWNGPQVVRTAGSAFTHWAWNILLTEKIVHLSCGKQGLIHVEKLSYVCFSCRISVPLSFSLALGCFWHVRFVIFPTKSILIHLYVSSLLHRCLWKFRFFYWGLTLSQFIFSFQNIPISDIRSLNFC